MKPDAEQSDMARLERRLEGLIQAGRIVAADYKTAKVQVKSGHEASAWLPWVTLRAGADRHWWAPEVGEQVLILSPMGDPAAGIVLPGLYRAAHPAPSNDPARHLAEYSDGAVFVYDRRRHHWDIHLPAGATVRLAAPGGVTIEGDVTVTGNVKATGEIADRIRSMGADREIYNRHTHPGDSGGTTGRPGASQ